MNINQPKLTDKEQELLEKVMNFSLQLDSCRICFKDIADNVELDLTVASKQVKEEFSLRTEAEERNRIEQAIKELEEEISTHISGKPEKLLRQEPYRSKLKKLRQLRGILNIIDKRNGRLQPVKLLGEFSKDKWHKGYAYVYLYLTNIRDASPRNRECALVTTFIHEMLHAWYNFAAYRFRTYAREIEEPMVEFGTLLFLHRMAASDKDFKKILDWAKTSVEVKQDAIGRVAAYGYGYYLFSQVLRGKKEGKTAIRMLEEYGNLTASINDDGTLKKCNDVYYDPQTKVYRYPSIEVNPKYEYQISEYAKQIVENLDCFYPFGNERDVFELFCKYSFPNIVGHIWKDGKTSDIIKIEAAHYPNDMVLEDNRKGQLVLQKTFRIVNDGTYSIEYLNDQEWYPIFDTSFNKIVFLEGFIYVCTCTNKHIILPIKSIKKSSSYLDEGLERFQKAVMENTYFGDDQDLFDIKDDSIQIRRDFVCVESDGQYNYFSMENRNLVFRTWVDYCFDLDLTYHYYNQIFAVISNGYIKILDLTGRDVSNKHEDLIHTCQVQYDQKLHPAIFKKAVDGDMDAQLSLGMMYENGKDLRTDLKEASKWYRKAAEQGQPEAQYRLGRLYENGKGVRQNLIEAANWYLKAAGQEYADASHAIDDLLGSHRTIKPCISRDQLMLYRERAEKGNMIAQYNLGRIYQNGTGNVEQDLGEAVRWHRKAAEQGHKEALAALDKLLGQKRVVMVCPIEDLKWYYRVKPEMFDDLYCNEAFIKRMDKELIGMYRERAENGCAKAQFGLGLMYQHGWGETQDLDEAFRWFKEAAESFDEAQYRLGEMYQNGWGTKQDLAKAVQCYRKVAEQGHKKAFKALDAIFGDENKAIICPVEDIKWYYGIKPQLFDDVFCKQSFIEHIDKELIDMHRERAEKGWVKAQYSMGLMYQHGWGVEQDQDEAARWFRFN